MIVKRVYYGLVPIRKIYLGSKLVWQSAQVVYVRANLLAYAIAAACGATAEAVHPGGQIYTNSEEIAQAQVVGMEEVLLQACATASGGGENHTAAAVRRQGTIRAEITTRASAYTYGIVWGRGGVYGQTAIFAFSRSAGAVHGLAHTVATMLATAGSRSAGAVHTMGNVEAYTACIAGGRPAGADHGGGEITCKLIATVSGHPELPADVLMELRGQMRSLAAPTVEASRDIRLYAGTEAAGAAQGQSQQPESAVMSVAARMCSFAGTETMDNRTSAGGTILGTAAGTAGTKAAGATCGRGTARTRMASCAGADTKKAVEWIDPVQTGSSLYIRMAASATQTGAALQIR